MVVAAAVVADIAPVLFAAAAVVAIAGRAVAAAPVVLAVLVTVAVADTFEPCHRAKLAHLDQLQCRQC